MSSRFIDRLSIRRRPRGLPLMRQWWGKLLFMHWPVPASLLRPLLAPQLSIATYRCRVFHRPWPLRRAEVSAHDSTLLEALGLPAPTGDPLLHYAEALKVDIWPLRRVVKLARASALEAANVSESLG